MWKFYIAFACVAIITVCAQNERVEAVLGEDTVLPCIASADKDIIRTILWFKGKKERAIYRDWRNGSNSAQLESLDPAGRYSLAKDADFANLTIRQLSRKDAGMYHCRVDYAHSPSIKTYVDLKIFAPPEELIVVYHNESPVEGNVLGPFHVNDEIDLTCVAFKGVPRPELSWWVDGKLVRNATFPISETRVRSDLIYGPLKREDHGRRVSCKATTHPLFEPRSITFTILMYMGPESVILYGPAKPIIENTTTTFNCEALGAHPPPAMYWMKNGISIAGLVENRTESADNATLLRTTSEVIMEVGMEDDGARILCCVDNNSKKPGCISSNVINIEVQYKPRVFLLADSNVTQETTVLKGANVTLTCDVEANPWIYEHIWLRDDDVVETSEDDMEDKCPMLDVIAASDADEGFYYCVATNKLGSTKSAPMFLQVQYPPACEQEDIVEYSLGQDESINITCTVKGNPEPHAYHWAFVNETLNSTDVTGNEFCIEINETLRVLQYTINGNENYGTIMCWGLNNVSVDGGGSSGSPCGILITDLGPPHPPADCMATNMWTSYLAINCKKGHDGGLPQKFNVTVRSDKTAEEIVLVNGLEPRLTVREPAGDYVITIVAFNDKGSSEVILTQENITIDYDGSGTPDHVVTNITTLSLALCGGVSLLVICACALVLCVRDSARDRPNDLSRVDSREPALCAYGDDSNCENCTGSEAGSPHTVRRSSSFRRAISARTADIQRTSSFQSPRCMNAPEPQDCTDRHNTCRVHSLQNLCSTLNRRRDLDALCDHLLLHLPTDLPNYSMPKAPVPFYTMPRKSFAKVQRDATTVRDDVSDSTQNSDSLPPPPPPEEFKSFRTASELTDSGSQRAASYSVPRYMNVERRGTIRAGNVQQRHQFHNVIISPMNTVGLPSTSRVQNNHNLFTYPENNGLQNMSDESHRGSCAVQPTIAEQNENRF